MKHLSEIDLECAQIPEVTELRRSIDSYNAATGERLATHFERLQRRQGSELAQLRALRQDLRRLPAGHPLRKRIAESIVEQARFHLSNALRTAKRLLEDAQAAEAGRR